jgi:energy-converting hydrogenase B subunit F
MFLKPKPNELEVSGEVPRAMIFAMGILLVIIVLLGIFPDVVTNGISNFVGGIL